MPTTLFPVTFQWFQALLNQLGYGFSHLDPDPDKPIIHWEHMGTGKHSHALPKDAPKLVTTLKPDFDADGHNEKVYDRDYVVDLLDMLIDGDVSDRHRCLAEVMAALCH